MTVLNVILNGDGAWPDLMDKPVVEVDLNEVALLKNGTVEGGYAVMFRIDLPNGTTAIAQTTLSLFEAASKAFQNRVAVESGASCNCAKCRGGRQ